MGERCKFVFRKGSINVYVWSSQNVDKIIIIRNKFKIYEIFRQTGFDDEFKNRYITVLRK